MKDGNSAMATTHRVCARESERGRWLNEFPGTGGELAKVQTSLHDAATHAACLFLPASLPPSLSFLSFSLAYNSLSAVSVSVSRT